MAERGNRGDTSETIPRDFADRLAMNFWNYPLSIPLGSHIILGALPAGMPVDVPLPAGSRVLGSVVTQYADGTTWRRGSMVASGEAVRIFLDAPGNADVAFESYESMLREQGWTAAPNFQTVRPRETPYFDSAPVPTSWVRAGQFCAGPGGPSLLVNVFAASPDVSDVRLFLVPTDSTACQSLQPLKELRDKFQASASDFGRRMARVSPRFEAPIGARITGSRGREGDRHWIETTTCESALSIEALAAHFGEQILAVGWSEQGSGVNGGVAWSTWSTTEAGEWEGTLLVVEDPQPDHRFLSWRMWAKDDEGVYPRRG